MILQNHDPPGNQEGEEDYDRHRENLAKAREVHNEAEHMAKRTKLERTLWLL